MKAFLLAAGLGTRLRPLTDTVPKCMLRFGGWPLLGIWLEKLASAGVTDVLVNTHYQLHMVNAFVDSRPWPLRVHVKFERELLGSAGTLLAHADWVRDEEFFLACNADGLTDFDLTELIKAHREYQPVATIATHRSENPSASGILDLDSEGIMLTFTEKPEHSVSDIANAGMYAFSPSVLDDIARTPPKDIGYNLLPLLNGRARTVPVTGYFRDIGTLEDYRLAQEEWATRDH